MRKSGNRKVGISKSKRLLSVCISMSMVLGVCSAFALADDEEPIQEQEIQAEENAEADLVVEEPADVQEEDDAVEPADVQEDGDAVEPDDSDEEVPEEIASEDEVSDESVVEEASDVPTYDLSTEPTPVGTALTVADGVCTDDTINNLVPFYRFYNYTKAQFIVPAAQLTAMSGSAINTIEFYMTGASGSTTDTDALDGNYVVILSEVESTTMTSLIDVSSATVAFDGYIKVSRGEKPITINLTTPYLYGGGNLLVTTMCTSSKYSASFRFYGIYCENAACENHRDDSPYDASATGGTVRNFMPKTTFYYGDGQATVTTAPTANDRVYDGTSQELVTAGVASGGTMAYALGSDGTTAPTSGWDSEIPSDEDAGTYYVWYKAVGSKAEFDSDPKCVEVTIDKADSYDTHFPVIAERNAAGEVFLQQGSSLALLTYAGKTVGGTEMYSLDGVNYSTEIPTVTSAGEYRIYLMIKGDKNHNDCDYGPSGAIYVVNYAFASGADSSWLMNSSNNLTFTIKRSRMDDLTFGNVAGVYVDDTAVPDSSFGLEQGSAVITLSAEYLKTLAEGKHSFRVEFTDPYTVTTSFTIVKASPQTGEFASPMLIVLSGMFLAAGAAFVVKSRKA